MASIGKVKTKDLNNVHCSKCGGRAHFATHYYEEQVKFFGGKSRISVCKAWLDENNISVNNPNVSPMP